MKPLRYARPGEVEITAIRAQGAGGQHVNKTSSAAHLRFDVHASSLPDAVKQRLLALGDARITLDGVVVIKAQDHRSWPMNRADALARLDDLITTVAIPPKTRHATKPTQASRRRRLDGKTQQAQRKDLRSKVRDAA
ncbi:MAG: alternative ribosome rescue aminoacyl-tRNA hydrolase ArfB [Burkholderiales bacterium]